MSFVHPYMLYLAPLVALPIIIHLLNRVRYRRVRWAAIDFLLSTEQRAVRRAKVRQWLLMAMRMLLLAVLLLALAQPILGGGLAALLGSSSQVAILLDNSPSMSALDSRGTAFERGRTLATDAVEGLPGSVRVLAGTISGRYDSPLREPMQSKDDVLPTLQKADLRAGLDDVAGSIKAAAEALQSGGGGGMIWLLTDMRASGWSSSGEGAWQAARDALEKAGRPRLVISTLTPSLTVNRWIEGAKVSPEILLEGDVPRLTATVRSEGAGGMVNVELHVEGRRIHAQSVQIEQDGAAEVVFNLPAVTEVPQSGYLQLDSDGLPQDNRYYFVIRPSQPLPVLVVDSRPPGGGLYDRDGDLVSLALAPPQTLSARSPFAVARAEASKLTQETLSDYQGIVLTEAVALDEKQVQLLQDYVRDGGWLMIFPGDNTDSRSFNSMSLSPATLGPKVSAPEGGLWHLGFVASSPVVNWLTEAGLEMMLVKKVFELKPGERDEVLLALDTGQPMLVRSQVGRGRIYTWSIGSNENFSKLPVWMLLPIVHDALREHVAETGASLSIPAYRRLGIPGQLPLARVITPDEQMVRLSFTEENPTDTFFAGTEQAGIYRLASSEQPDALAASVAVGAVNVPGEESSLETVSAAQLRDYLGFQYPLYVLEGDRDILELDGSDSASSAASAFPLAMLGLALLLTEAILGWSMSRPHKSQIATAASTSANGK